MKRSISNEEWQALEEAHFAGRGNENPAVYVGTYGKYVNGSLDGMWVDLSTFEDYDEFIDFCRLLHEDEHSPEFMYQDYENFPAEWYCESGLSRDFDKILEFAHLDRDERELVMAYAQVVGEYANIDEVRDRYCGDFDSEEDFAWHIFDECYAYDLPEFAQRYFDIAAFARDLFAYDYTLCDGKVFRCC